MPVLIGSLLAAISACRPVSAVVTGLRSAVLCHWLRRSRLSAPIAMLLALLQRTPVDRIVTVSEELPVADTIGAILRSGALAAAAFGALDALAGATTLVATSPTPAAATVGTNVSIGFTVDNTINIGSWKITGTLPPGTKLSAKEGGTALTGPGTLDATTPGAPDGYGGTVGGNATTTPLLTGAPTTAGTYTFSLQAFEFGGLAGLASGTFNYTVVVNAVTTTVAPTVTDPQSQTVQAGAAATFTVTATGSPTPTLQWQKDGTAISGATNATYSNNSAQAGDAGTYTVVATNSAGTVTSHGATLTVTVPGTAPSFTTQPSPQIVAIGSTATFTAAVSASPAATYQWQKDGVALANGSRVSGASTATLAITGAAGSDSGVYTLVATNSAGAATSTGAMLTVNAAPISPTAAWLTNLSVRTTMLAGQNPLTVGLYVSGGAKNILVRASGPALAALGLTGTLLDPQLQLFQQGGSTTVPILTNDDWSSSLSSTFASVGAFGFPSGSKDAAFVQSLNAGYTIQIPATGPGTVLVEAYDLVSSSNSPRMINVSARNRVGVGDDVLVEGFYISGSGTKKLLIRAVGPTLAGFGVTTALADPKLEVYDGTTKIAENDNWDASLAPLFPTVGAFGLLANSKDAAMVVTLAAGKSYTILARGADGGTGEAIVEVYEAP